MLNCIVVHSFHKDIDESVPVIKTDNKWIRATSVCFKEQSSEC